MGVAWHISDERRFTVLSSSGEALGEVRIPGFHHLALASRDQVRMIEKEGFEVGSLVKSRV